MHHVYERNQYLITVSPWVEKFGNTHQHKFVHDMQEHTRQTSGGCGVVWCTGS